MVSVSDHVSSEFSKNFTGDYFQKSKVLNSNNFFEKPSSQYKYLVIRPDDTGNLSVKEIDISFYVYTNKFLGEVGRPFPQKPLPKYTIYEKVKYGVGKKKNNSSDLEVEYTNFSIRQSQHSDLMVAVDKFLAHRVEAQQLFHEKVSYTATPDEGLWRSEEIQIKEGKESIRWKNYSAGTLDRNYPHTEFFPTKNTLEYSRIYSFEDYSYKKIFQDIPSESTLYSNKEFVIYYFQGDKFDQQDSNRIYSAKTNKQLILFKTDLPLIIYKKKESTIE